MTTAPLLCPFSGVHKHVCVQFRQHMNDMNLLYFMADKFVLLPFLLHEYLNSSWCVFEAILAELSGISPAVCTSVSVRACVSRWLTCFAVCLCRQRARVHS